MHMWEYILNKCKKTVVIYNLSLHRNKLKKAEMMDRDFTLAAPNISVLLK